MSNNLSIKQIESQESANAFSMEFQDKDVDLCQSGVLYRPESTHEESSFALTTPEISIEEQTNKSLNELEEPSPEQQKVALTLAKSILAYQENCGDWSDIIVESSIEDEIVFGRRTDSCFSMIVIDEFGNVMVSIKNPFPDIKRRYFLDYVEVDIDKLLVELYSL